MAETAAQRWERALAEARGAAAAAAVQKQRREKQRAQALETLLAVARQGLTAQLDARRDTADAAIRQALSAWQAERQGEKASSAAALQAQYTALLKRSSRAPARAAAAGLTGGAAQGALTGALAAYRNARAGLVQESAARLAAQRRALEKAVAQALAAEKKGRASDAKAYYSRALALTAAQLRKLG